MAEETKECTTKRIYLPEGSIVTAVGFFVIDSNGRLLWNDELTEDDDIVLISVPEEEKELHILLQDAYEDAPDEEGVICHVNNTDGKIYIEAIE